MDRITEHQKGVNYGFKEGRKEAIDEVLKILEKHNEDGLDLIYVNMKLIKQEVEKLKDAI